MRQSKERLNQVWSIVAYVQTLRVRTQHQP
jgi:hypothetical protein